MKEYIQDIIAEFKRVQWPSWDELQNDAIVVAIASVIIALIIYVTVSYTHLTLPTILRV